MKFQEALEKLNNGFAVSLGGSKVVIHPDKEEDVVLDITLTEALSDKWQVVYGRQQYKEDMCILADVLGRLTAAGVKLSSNGEELREIDSVPVKELGPECVPGLISNYGGKWKLR